MFKLQCLVAGTAIRVTRAPQPTDIIWENQDIGFWNRTCRQFTVCSA